MTNPNGRIVPLELNLESFSDVFSPNWCDSHCILYPVILLIVFSCGVGAMRVAAESRRSFREALEVSGLRCTFGDAALDSVIRHVRQTINLKKPSGLDEEQEALSLALVEIRCLVEDFAQQEGWDESTWQLFLWNAFCASVSGTQSAERVPFHSESDEAWTDLVALVLALDVSQPVPHGIAPWYGQRWVIALFLMVLGIICLILCSYMDSGRAKLSFFCAGALVLLVAEIWRRCGRDVGIVLKASSKHTVLKTKLDLRSNKRSEASLKLQQENQELKALVASLRDGKPVEPITSEPTPLMKSLSALTGVAHTADVVTTDLGPLCKGDVVQVTGLTSSPSLCDKKGVVKDLGASQITVLFPGRLHLQLDRACLRKTPLRDVDPDFEVLLDLVYEALDLKVEKSIDSSGMTGAGKGEVYAPLSSSSTQHLMSQAKKVKDALVLWSSRSALFPNWPKKFWESVGSLEPLEPLLMTILKLFGYLGEGRGVMPRTSDLKTKLEELESQGAASHSMALFRMQGDGVWTDDSATEGMEAWETALSADLKRAGPEIYMAFRSSGLRNARDWVQSMFSVDRRSGPLYLELFNHATVIDYVAAGGKGNQADTLKLLAESDTAEIGLRRIAAWVHETRTGDRAAASAMLAVRPMSLETDVAPAWLVSEVGIYSQAEHKRKERAKAQKQDGFANSSGGKGKGKKDGKGKKKGNKGGGSSSTTQG